LIDAIEASAPRPKLLASVRDVLQSRTKPGRNEETVALIQRHFDKVLVHGDPQFIKFESSFPLAKDIAGKLLYTGLVCGRKPKALPNCQFDMLVSAGGGAVGAQLVRAAMDAAKLLPETYSWCVIVGPKLPEKEFLRICDSAPANVMVERFRADFIDLLARVKLSVSQAGYNTVCDVLRSGCRSVLVPFATGGETEQTARAQRLQALGMATMLLETEISAQKLATTITRELHRSVRNHIGMINLDGAAQTGKILNKLMN
jgi:predicted glycosyltransferase